MKIDKRVTTAPIVQVYIDPKLNSVYVLSMDRYIHRCDISTMETTFSCKISSGYPVSMKIVPKTQTAYVSDDIGNIMVFDLSSDPPMNK